MCAQILIGPGPLPFQEVPVPDDPTPVWVGEGEYYEGADVFLRRGQQDGIEFDPGLAIYADFRVRVNNGPWQVLHNGGNRTGPILWDSPPSAPPLDGVLTQHEVTISYSGSTAFQYDFDLFTVPPANRAFASTEGGGNGALQHTILVWSGTDGGLTLDKPLLVVEGIDASNENDAASYYALGARPERKLFPRGQAEGADVAILDFGDGGRDMRLNAAVVRLAVLAMKQYKQSTRSTDVAGVSMGGVVARYALAKMEEDGDTHDVGTFASIDAPQQGAVIDGGLQNFIKANTAPETWPAALARPAGRQLLPYNAFNAPGTNDHIAFYTELRALNGGTGYPQLTQNVGVSFGAPQANPHDGTTWLDVVLNRTFEYASFDVAGSIAQPGSFLPLKQTQIWGIKEPGFVFYNLERFTHPTFIPFESALDIQTGGQSPFNGPLIHADPNSPSFHDVVPSEIVQPLLNRLGYELPPVASVNVVGPTSLSGWQDGTFVADVGDPSTTYQYAWEWRAFPCGSSFAGARTENETHELATSSGGGEMASRTSRYVTYGVWHDGYGSGPSFVKSFPAGIRAEVRVTASGAGSAPVSPIHTVYVECSGRGGGDGDALTGSGTASAKAASTAEERGHGGLSLSPPSPNPASGRAAFAVELPHGQPAELTVYDALGRNVLTEHVAASDETELDLSQLAPGPYVVRLMAGTEIVSTRLMVTR